MVREANAKKRDSATRSVIPYLSRSDRAAIALCSTCPVRRECAEASLRPLTDFYMGANAPRDPRAAVNVVHGIWAGVPRQLRTQIMDELGHGPEAVEMILTVGEKLAREYPGDPASYARSARNAASTVPLSASQAPRSRRKRTLEERFWPKVDRRELDECWPWMGSIKPSSGVGVLQFDGKVYRAHHVAFELTSERVPGQRWVIQTCGTRTCVNSAHLRSVTKSEADQHYAQIL